jgi:peptide/nickel transport system substrate-binding protein
MLRKLCFVISMVSLLTLVVGGCAPAATPSETGEPVSTPEPAATPAPAEMKVATFIMWMDFVDLEPAFGFSSESVVLNNCYENLTWYAPPGSEELVEPGLATSWEANEDATEWTFHLREGVTFQDGAPFDAEAVKTAIEYYLGKEGAGCSFIWDAVAAIDVIDDSTVKFELKYPAPLDLIATSSQCAGIMSPNTVTQPNEWFNEGNCVGTGPYTIESYDKGQRLIITRFDDYWGGWQENQFDKIDYEMVSDTAVGLQMIEGGDADFFRDIPADRISALQARDDLNVYIQPSMQHLMLMLNTKKPPLDNQLVRQALSYSFPYDQYIERSEGLYQQSRGGVPQAMWGYCDDCFQYTYDLDKAKELLEQAGYGDGGFELSLPYMPEWPSEVSAVELWTFPLSDLGIKLNAQAMESAPMMEIGRSSDPASAQDIFPLVWWPTWVTPFDPLYTMYHCEEEPYFNFSYWCNADYDNLLDEANRLTGVDLDGASALFVEAQKILVEEAPAIFLVDLPSTWAIAADIQGFVDNPAYQNTVFFHELTTTR